MPPIKLFSLNKSSILKMWFSKTTNIFICVCCVAFVESEDICDQPYKIPKWETVTSNQPADLLLGEVPEVAAALEAQVENVRENFSLTLLANPFIEDGSKCPPASSSYLNLRTFHKSFKIIKGVNESESIFFGNIFTGCYYFEMTNAEGKKWLWEPEFFRTSYHYYNTMLRCEKFAFKPQDYKQSRQLKYNIEVPLTCLQVRCRLYERDKETNYSKHDSYLGNTQAIMQDCLITNVGNGKMPVWKCTRNDMRLKLRVSVAVKKGDGWKTSITWDNLKQDGACYETLFEQYNHTCHMNYADLMTWEPVVQFGALTHGFNNNSNTVYASEHPDFFHSAMFSSILQILLGVTVTAILVYWMSKYAKILFKRMYITNNVLVKPQEISQLHNQKEPNHILLIYARDTTPFMRLMDTFRDRLQEISHFPVHDLYSINEWNVITKLGATGWVEDLLRDGCKVVWIDTPQFRSMLKDNKLDKVMHKQHAAHDFRDEAIPYAVTLATNLFQNATTQYRCHFVVQLEGFQVEDEDYDPLLIVSPHARYHIPEHFSLLCEHLAR